MYGPVVRRGTSPQLCGRVPKTDGPLHPARVEVDHTGWVWGGDARHLHGGRGSLLPGGQRDRPLQRERAAAHSSAVLRAHASSRAIALFSVVVLPQLSWLLSPTTSSPTRSATTTRSAVACLWWWWWPTSFGQRRLWQTSSIV